MCTVHNSICLCFLCIHSWVKTDNFSVPQNSTTDISDKRMIGLKAKIQTLIPFRTLQSRECSSDFVQRASFSNNTQQSHEHHPGSSWWMTAKMVWPQCRSTSTCKERQHASETDTDEHCLGNIGGVRFDAWVRRKKCFRWKDILTKKVQRREESRKNLRYSVQRAMEDLCSGKVAVS